MFNKKYDKEKEIKINESLEKYKIENKELINKYYNIIQNDLEIKKERERTRNFNKKSLKLAGVIFGVIILVVAITSLPFLIIFSFDKSSIPIIAFEFISCFLVFFVIASICFKDSKTYISSPEYSNLFREKIIKKALYDYNSNISFYSNGCIPEFQYKAGNFEKYDKYSSEDRLNDKILGYNFMLADVHTEERVKNDDSISYYTIFNGPVAIVSLPYSTNFELSVIKSKRNYIDLNNQIEIDNLSFENLFDVYTNDNLKAMMILTPEVTNQIIDLCQKYHYDFEFKIIGSYIYFRFNSGNLLSLNFYDTYNEALGVAIYISILDGIRNIMTEVIKSVEKVIKK